MLPASVPPENKVPFCFLIDILSPILKPFSVQLKGSPSTTVEFEVRVQVSSKSLVELLADKVPFKLTFSPKYSPGTVMFMFVAFAFVVSE